VPETTKIVTSFVICSSSLNLDPRLQSRSDAPLDFAVEYAATSTPSPELSIGVTLFSQPPKKRSVGTRNLARDGGMAKSFFPEREKDTVRESQAQIGNSGWNAQLLPDLCNSLDQQIG